MWRQPRYALPDALNLGPIHKLGFRVVRHTAKTRAQTCHACMTIRQLYKPHTLEREGTHISSTEESQLHFGPKEGAGANHRHTPRGHGAWSILSCPRSVLMV